MNIWKQLLVYSLSFSVGLAPTMSFAARAPANEESQAQGLKEAYQNSGYKSGGDVGLWLEKNSSKFHFKMKAMVERIHLAHPEMKLPALEFTDFQVDGKTHTRMVVKSGKEQTIVELYKNNNQLVAKMNGQVITYNDLYYDHILDVGDINPQLTFEQLKRAQKVNPQAALAYQQQFRELMNALTTVEDLSTQVAPKEVSYIEYILNVANATEKDGKCIIGGNFSVISKDKKIEVSTGKPRIGNCGGDFAGSEELYCGGDLVKGGFKCKPLVYGLSKDSKPFCVPFQKDKKPSTYVSQSCNANMPLGTQEEKDNFVNSIINAKDMKTDSEKFFKDLKNHIETASLGCGLKPGEVDLRIKAGFTAFGINDFMSAFPVRKTKGKESFDYNEGHRTACMYLMNRLVLAKKAADCSQSRVLASESLLPAEKMLADKDCPAIEPNLPQVIVNGKHTSSCKELTEEAAAAEKELASGKITLDDPKVKEVSKGLEYEKKNNFNCPLVWPPVAAVPTVVTVAPPLKVEPKEGNICSKSKTSSFICGGLIGFAIAACIFKFCKGSDAPLAPMPVGKPGEPETNRSQPGSPNRPRPGTPVQESGTK